jgi:hypothetical protein
MDVAFHLAIRIEAIGQNCAVGFDILSHEAMQGGSPGVGDAG